MCNRHKTVAVLVHSCLTAICPVVCACVVAVVVGGGGRGDNTLNAIFKEQSLLQRSLILVVVLVCS